MSVTKFSFDGLAKMSNTETDNICMFFFYMYVRFRQTKPCFLVLICYNSFNIVEIKDSTA